MGAYQYPPSNTKESKPPGKSIHDKPEGLWGRAALDYFPG